MTLLSTYGTLTALPSASISVPVTAPRGTTETWILGVNKSGLTGLPIRGRGDLIIQGYSLVDRAAFLLRRG